nr:ACT domain-containing protein [Actinomycetota bacterium]
GKLLAAVGATGSPGDKVLIGLGMLPRGEVGLIFAGLGLREGVLGDDLYAALLIVVLATTLVTPPALKWRLTALRSRRRAVASATRPEGGWLVVPDGVVDLAGEPPSHLALEVALDAALAATTARPGSRLLDWFGALPDEPLRWDKAATQKLFELLRRGNARSWRFLDTTGVLERALPELAAAIRRRQADPLELDATHALRWSLVERLHELIEHDEPAGQEHADLKHPEWLLLAALILDSAGDAEPPVAAARQLAKRLDLGAGAEQEIALLVGESELLRRAATRVDALDESRVLPIASHVRQGERAAALYLLSLALGELEPVDRGRLDELHRRVQVVLGEGGLMMGEGPFRMSERLAAAERAATSRAVVDRIRATPATYVASQSAPAIARQAALLEPLPPRGRARVAVTATDDPQRWCVDVAARDQHGLLALVTGVLAGAGVDVLAASATTWGDGGAIEAFVIRAAGRPDQSTLELAIAAGMRAGIAAPAVPDATVAFDDVASPWYTLCEIRAPDHPGLLRAFAAAIAAAGANVHGATIDTSGELAVDRFELTDRRGHKLDDGAKAALVNAVGEGVPPMTRSRLRRLGRKSQSRNIRMTMPKPASPTVDAGR